MLLKLWGEWGTETRVSLLGSVADAQSRRRPLFRAATSGRDQENT